MSLDQSLGLMYAVSRVIVALILVRNFQILGITMPCKCGIVVMGLSKREKDTPALAWDHAYTTIATFSICSVGLRHCQIK